MRGDVGRSSTRPARSSTAGCLVPDRRDPTVPVVEAGLLPVPALVASLFSPTIGAAARATGARLLPSRGGVFAATGAEERAAERLAAAIAGAERTALVRLAEPGGRWFERVAAAAGLSLVDGDLTAVAGGRPLDDVVTSWLCLAALTGAGVQLREWASSPRLTTGASGRRSIRWMGPSSRWCVTHRARHRVGLPGGRAGVNPSWTSGSASTCGRRPRRAAVSSSPRSTPPR